LPLDTKERIKDLCVELSTSNDLLRVQDLSTELQLAIHEHIEDLRQRLLEIPAARPFQNVGFDLSRRSPMVAVDSSPDPPNSEQGDSRAEIYSASSQPNGSGNDPSSAGNL
jgi:hypothetical protein